MARRTGETASLHLIAREREQRALALRKAGVDYDTIAREVGYRHARSAYNAVRRALERAAQESVTDREAVRTLELERLDRLLLALWPQAAQGEPGAVDRVLRIMERRARYLGLDTPQQVEVRDWRQLAQKAGIPNADDLFEQMVQQLVAGGAEDTGGDDGGCRPGGTAS